MTTETNSVYNTFKDAFAPVTDAFKNFQNMEVPEAAREFVKKQAETAKERAADFYAGSVGRPPNNEVDHRFVISRCNIDVAPHH